MRSHKHLNSLRDVYNFSVSKNNVVYSSTINGEIFYLNSSFQLLWSYLFERIQGIALFDKHIYTGDIFGKKSYFIDKSNFSILEIGLEKFALSTECKIVDNKIPALFKKNDKPKERGIFDLQTLTFLWSNVNETLIGLQTLNNNYCICKKSNSIILVDFQTGNFLWQYDLPEVEYLQGSNYPPAVSKEIHRILGVYNSILWIVSDMGHLIGLETETGECKYHLKTPINLSEIWTGWEVFVYAKKSCLDAENGIIYGLDGVSYWECNLKNPTETYLNYDLSDVFDQDLKDAGLWEVYYPSNHSEEIYFSKRTSLSEPTYVAVFNRKTRQITWTSRELGEEGVFKGINKIEYQDNRLYVLDRASKLHIFERENDA
jgi:outer membrane protein assembly factor BamB